MAQYSLHCGDTEIVRVSYKAEIPQALSKDEQEDIKNLELIYHLVKERGFTLEGAKIRLKEQKQDALDSFDIIRKLESIKGQLLKIKEQL